MHVCLYVFFAFQDIGDRNKKPTKQPTEQSPALFPQTLKIIKRRVRRTLRALQRERDGQWRAPVDELYGQRDGRTTLSCRSGYNGKWMGFGIEDPAIQREN